jgi:hypothetical protein
MRKVAAFLALCALALPTSAAASASFPTAVAVNVPAFAKSNFAHVIPSGMVVSPPPAGCAREHPGAVKLTLALGGHSSTGLGVSEIAWHACLLADKAYRVARWVSLQPARPGAPAPV